MPFDAWLTRLQDTAIATAIRENGSLFPWVEALHVLALTLVVGSIAIVDLRLIGWTSNNRRVRNVLAEVLPCAWVAFAFALVTGALLFSSNAETYAHNSFFRAKVVLLALLGLNTFIFERFTLRTVEAWDDAQRPPLKARAAGAISAALWIGVVICGRWIGFTRI